jgi:putative iron-dependent peroxidase
MKPQDVANTPGEHAIFIIFGLYMPGMRPWKRSRISCGDFSAVARSMRTRLPDSAVSFLMGLGAEGWGKLFPGRSVPKELAVFKEIKGAKYTAVSTPGDIFLHFRAAPPGLMFVLRPPPSSVQSCTGRFTPLMKCRGSATSTGGP